MAAMPRPPGHAVALRDELPGAAEAYHVAATAHAAAEIVTRIVDLASIGFVPTQVAKDLHLLLLLALASSQPVIGQLAQFVAPGLAGALGVPDLEIVAGADEKGLIADRPFAAHHRRQDGAAGIVVARLLEEAEGPAQPGMVD